MKRIIAFALIGAIAASLAFEAEAQRRLGGGRNLGRQSPQVQQRQATPPQQQAPAQQAAPANQPAPTQGPVPAARPSPMKGALLGLAAGLGIAALASHFGFGETLTALLTAGLVAVAGFAILGFVLRRTRGGTPQPAYGGLPSGGAPPESQAPVPMPRSAFAPAAGARPGSAMDEFAHAAAPASAAQPWGVPAGFDADGFLQQAKQYFTKLQGAWDRGSLADLHEFTTQEMFTTLTHELRARATNSHTEVLAIDATLLGIESTATEHVASVRFAGTLRVDGALEQVDEVWNLCKPVDGSSGWLLAGIQQLG